MEFIVPYRIYEMVMNDKITTVNRTFFLKAMASQIINLYIKNLTAGAYKRQSYGSKHPNTVKKELKVENEFLKNFLFLCTIVYGSM